MSDPQVPPIHFDDPEMLNKLFNIPTMKAPSFDSFANNEGIRNAMGNVASSARKVAHEKIGMAIGTFLLRIGKWTSFGLLVTAAVKFFQGAVWIPFAIWGVAALPISFFVATIVGSLYIWFMSK